MDRLHPIPEDRLHPIPVVAERLGHGRTWVYDLIREGRLPSVVVGPRGRRRVRESDLTAFIASLTDQRGGDAA
jgi:excisionase family DNA binding protein